MIKVGVVGGSGRLGVELLRLLVMHPNVRIQAVTSRRFAGERVENHFPLFRHHFEAEFVLPTPENLTKCDLVFMAASPATALDLAPRLLEKKIKVIDFSTAFQLGDADRWAAAFGESHPLPSLLNEAVCGLPETHRTHLRKARLVSIPSAHAAILQIGYLPLLESTVVDTSRLYATVVAGVDANDRASGNVTPLRETGDNIRAASIQTSTQHEITQGLHAIAGKPVNLTLVPQQVPVTRGMHATLFAQVSAATPVDIQALYEQRYADEPFVDIQPVNAAVETRSVHGANMCRIAIQPTSNPQTVVILVVIDNLVKGAAGQAIQAMNIMYGIPEAIGLKHLALMP